MKIAVYLMTYGVLGFAAGKSIQLNQQLPRKDRLLKRIECILGDQKQCERKVLKPRWYRGEESTIYTNGKIYAVHGKRWDEIPQEAMVVKGGKINFVGTSSEALEYFTYQSTVLDLHGATILPGIHDVHIHPLESASEVGVTCQLKSNTDPDSEEIKNIFRTCAKRQIGTNWILGGGHSISSILKHIRNGGKPPRKIIDEVLPNVPVVMLEETSHSVWVNTKALQLANITKYTTRRPGGVIMREPMTNEPNGILLEDEGISIMEFALKPTAELEELNYQGLIYGLEKLNANGITSVCDARLFWTRNHDKAWDRACRDDKLTVRANLGLWAYPQKEDGYQIQKLKDMYTNGNPDCFLKKNQIKVYIDGLLESTTAAMEEPYLENLHLPGIPDNRGMNIFDQARLTKYVRELQHFAEGKGFDFHIHAIGDRGVHQALNAFNDSWIQGTRHRMTHLEQVDELDINRFRRLNVIADFQVAGNFTLPSYRKDLAKLVGKDRAYNSIPVKSVYDTGAKVTLSSDWDVSDLNPFVGLQHAISRGHQSITIQSAVEMYTINAAYAMRQEDVVGSLEVGKHADFIVIDTDIMDPSNKDSIYQTKVLQTVLEGEEVYWKRNDFIKDVTCTVSEGGCYYNGCDYY
ncbi:putative amidohydrolase YtcJ [Saccostrea echinata]|uniref:putative amidohydrolase YtcJ n=1 Tax=Saccostrea echinata TaxID=191078 RepID=UPI002A7FA18F|nr:putative amidohydrolase YtcJ [Saccostrea echinata]